MNDEEILDNFKRTDQWNKYNMTWNGLGFKVKEFKEFQFGFNQMMVIQ